MQTKIKGAPDYDQAEFWDTKFATGQDVGEWLNSGEALLEAVLRTLEGKPRQHEMKPSVLHLGPGISKLGSKLCEEFARRGWSGSGIVNVDFSSEAVRQGQGHSQQNQSTQAMHWLQADLCSWKQVKQLSQFAPFDVILDKSTSDAIATSSSRTFTPSSSSSQDQEDDILPCPIVREIVDKSGDITMSPVELVALHLAPLTQKGTVWIALSYSASRFDDFPHLADYWTILSRTPVQAPSGQVSSSYAHAPPVFHWIFVLQRK